MPALTRSISLIDNGNGDTTRETAPLVAVVGPPVCVLIDNCNESTKRATAFVLCSRLAACSVLMDNGMDITGSGEFPDAVVAVAGPPVSVSTEDRTSAIGKLGVQIVQMKRVFLILTITSDSTRVSDLKKKDATRKR